ncbi:MAG: transposase, partial [Chitinophagales bacterium]
MATNSIPLLELLHKAGAKKDLDFLCEAVQALSQAVIELEAAEKIGAAPYERSEGRITQRNGYRDRVWNTRVGTVALKI